VEPQGAWDTPPATPSSVDQTFTHTFDVAGTWTVPVVVSSIGGPLPHAVDGSTSTFDLCPRIYDHDLYGGYTIVNDTLDVVPRADGRGRCGVDGRCGRPAC
jgi:hypothetical protein